MSTTKFEANDAYSDEELLALYRELIARQAVAGVEYDIRGRRIRFPGMAEARAMIDWLEARIGAAEGPAVNVARLHRR